MDGKKLDGDELRRLALRWISRQPLTAFELKTRLYRRGGDPGQVSGMVQDFIEAGYIDEAAIAEDAVRRGREVRLVGRFLLKYELFKHGLDEELVNKTLDEGYPEREEGVVARRFAQKSLKTMQKQPSDKRYRRIAGALDRRGFKTETIAQVMREIGLELEN